ncbi:MAG: ATP-binding cassette domain-containing protein [Gammaproteobacteria bacterium]|nr:ATP-binding cassette domain-containing protein [Gammaproteobacteria bacterium]
MSQILLDAKQILLINDVRPLFCPISFEIMSGSRYQLVGINGVGKSSLLNALHSSVIDEGEIIYHISKNEIGYLPHKMKVYEQLTLSEQLNLFSSLSKTPSYCSQISSLLIPGHLMVKKLSQMSQGERQRACLLLLLCFPLKLVLLDEPSSHQDTHYKKNIEKVISVLLANGVSILETSHQASLNNVIQLEPYDV